MIQIAVTEEAPVTQEKSGFHSSTGKIEPSSLTTEITGGSVSPDKSAETPGFGDPQDESENVAKSVKGNEYEEVWRKVKKSNKIKKIFVVIELIAFVCVMGLLIYSLTLTKLEIPFLRGIKLWKGCVLVSVIFCGRLVTKWLMIALIWLIKKSFTLKLMVLYYVDGLRRSARAFIWFGLVLLSWRLLVETGVERSKETRNVLNFITRGLVGCLVGTVLWMIKTCLFKLLVASRLSKSFFYRIQEAMFDEYVIYTCMKQNKEGRKRKEKEMEKGEVYQEEMENKKGEVNQVAGKRKKIEKISAWTMEKLINHISNTKLSILSASDELGESDAEEAVNKIFRNVEDGSKWPYIKEEMLLRFFQKDEVDEIMLKLGAEHTREIKKSDLKKWVVNVYKKRTSLAHFINNSKEAMQELNRLFTGIVMVLIIIVWLLIVRLLTTEALLLILSQLLLAVFLFGNTAKNVFEAIIFLFVTHPFEVGDRCVVDGVQMVVEEMHILTTTFLRHDKEKIFYPNSVLATKPISNFYRSKVDMRVAVEITSEVLSENNIFCIECKINDYMACNPREWTGECSVVVKQIKDEKMIMDLNVTHIIINVDDKIKRRYKLVLKLMEIFEDLDKRLYHVLPQEVRSS